MGIPGSPLKGKIFIEFSTSKPFVSYMIVALDRNHLHLSYSFIWHPHEPYLRKHSLDGATPTEVADI